MNNFKNKSGLVLGLIVSFSAVAGMILYASGPASKSSESVVGSQVDIFSDTSKFESSELINLLKLKKEMEIGKLQVDIFQKLLDKTKDEKKKETIRQALLKAPRDFAEKFLFWTAHNWPILLVNGLVLYWIENKTGLVSTAWGVIWPKGQGMVPLVYDSKGNELRNCEFNGKNFICEKYKPNDESQQIGKNCKGYFKNDDYVVRRCSESLSTAKLSDQKVDDNIKNNLDGISDKKFHICSEQEIIDNEWGFPSYEWFVSFVKGVRLVCED